MGLGACDDDAEAEIPDAGGSQEVSCDTDTSFSIDSFYEGTFAETLGDTICPRRDADFWRFNMATNKLARVDVQYNKLSDIQLGVQWWRPSGRCTDASPASCAQTDDCTAPQVCDQLRGCVSPEAADCFQAGGSECEPPLICNLSPEPLPREVVLENRLTAAPDEHQVVAYFPAFNGGEHFLVVQDQQEQEEDDEFQYELTVTEIDDPDPNEPNNSASNATPLTSGVAQTRYLSYQLDTDWYVIEPGFATAAVIDIELRSDASNVSEPTWIVYQGDFRLDSVSEEIEGSGANQERVRANTLVMPNAGPIIIEVRNRNTTSGTQTIPSYNPDEPYTLSVSVFEDTDEGANRDDSPADANQVVLGATPGAGGLQTLNGTIIARNDSDWYRLDAGDFGAPTVPGDNSLLFARVSAADPETTNFQLLAQFFKPNGTACSPSIQCPGGRVCAEDISECLDVWVQRPDPRGPGNPEEGGLSPNLLQSQLPIHRSKMNDEPRIYLRVVHDQATTRAIPGFDQTAQYTVELEHRAEPDPGDLSTRDNDFLARPLTDDDNLRPRDYNAEWRPTNTATVTSPAGGAAFAQVVPGTVLNPTGCQQLPLEAWTAQGGPSNATFNLSATDAVFVGDCAAPVSSTTAAVTFASGVGQVAVDTSILTATTLEFTIDIPALGTDPVFTVPLDAARALTIEGEDGPDFSRSIATPSDAAGNPTGDYAGSATLRIRFPQILQGSELLSVTSVSGGVLVCATDNNGNCEGGGTTCASDLDDPATAPTSCTLEATAGNDFYAFQIASDGSDAPVVIEIEGAGAPSAYDRTTLLLTPYRPPSATIPFGEITGYISYDGDQDFFRVDVAGVTNAGLTGYLQYPESDVDIRVSLERGDRTLPLGDQNESADLAECSFGAPLPTNTCRQAAKDDVTGPLDPVSPQCQYSLSGDTIDVWVNDVYSNDFDLTNTYTIRFELQAGCPDLCNAFVCSQ